VTRATALGRFDRLAVEHGSAGRGFTSNPFAVGHDEEMVHALKQAAVAPLREPAIHGGPGRQIVGNHEVSGTRVRDGGRSGLAEQERNACTFHSTFLFDLFC
jgi:hypothetical protein